MKRNIVVAAAAAVVLLGVAVVGGAAVTGMQAKKKLHELPAAWQAQWPLMKVTSQKYERGLFSSTNLITLEFGCKAGSDPAGAITIQQRIKHGPLPGFSGFGAAVIDTELLVPEAERKQVAELIGDKSPFTAHTEVGFGGSMKTTFFIPAINYKAPAGGQVNWQGLSGEVRQNSAGMHYDVASPGFSVAAKDEKTAFAMKFNSLHMHGDLAGGEGSIWLRPGTGVVELVSFDMDATASPERGMPPMKVAFTQLKASAENKIENDLLSNTTKFTTSGVVNDVRVDKVELLASVRRLHAPSYQRLIQRFVDTSAAACDMKQAVSPQVMMAQMQQDFAALLPFNPEYAIDKLSLEIDGKRGELSYAIGINGATAADAQIPLPALLATKAQLRGQAKVPAMWIEKTVARFAGGAQAPQGDPAGQTEMANVMLAKLVNDGFIVREGDMLTSQVSFDKGQMTVNGKPVGQPAQ
jgi:uncharacterized protein YdgA (DUF945 family)